MASKFKANAAGNWFAEDDLAFRLNEYDEYAVEEAVRLGVSAPAIAVSLFKRFQSGQDDVFSDKVIAGLRREFGGHQVHYKE